MSDAEREPGRELEAKAALNAALARLPAEQREAIELAICASSLVIHQLGTTGTASVAQLRALAVEDGRAFIGA